VGNAAFVAGAASFVAGADRSGGVSTLRLDAQRTLVLAQGRAYIGVAATETDAAGAAVVRGTLLSMLGNVLAARGRVPAVMAMAGGDAMVSDNRIELRAADTVTAVLLATPALVLNANRVRHAGPAIAVLNANAVAALGNLTQGGITVGGAALPAPWNALNLLG